MGYSGSKTPNVMNSTKYLFNKNWIFESEKIEKSSSIGLILHFVTYWFTTLVKKKLSHIFENIRHFSFTNIL